jgi:Beta-lactamase enzyme family
LLVVYRVKDLSRSSVRETMGVFGSRSMRETALLLGAVGLVAVPSTCASAARRDSPARPCLAPGVNRALDQVWRPDMRAAIRYAQIRTGDIAFAVRTNERFYGYRPNHVEWSASVLKPMLLAAYLDRRSVAHRALNRHDRSLLYPMVTRSDNTAATDVLGIVGDGALYALAHRVGMTQFAVAPIWGESHITARDQTKFFLHIGRYVTHRHRRYAMRLLASITPSQRWGIGEVAPKGWKLYFKGGWGSGTGLIDHQVALLVRGCSRVSIAVLTMYDGSHAYGKQTLREMFKRLLRGLPTRASTTQSFHLLARRL